MSGPPGAPEDPGRRRRIGELLVEAGYVTREQLDEALREQQRSGGRICYNLVRLGHLTADDLTGFLRDQFGVAAVNLEHFRVPEPVLRLVPADFARARRVVPLALLDRTLTVAVVDPTRDEDLAALRELTGLDVEPVISPEASVEAALARLYPGGAGGPAPGEGVIELGDEGEARATPAGDPQTGLPPEAWLRRFLLQAVRRRSREIHLEPVEAGLRVRYRVRGALQDGETAPAAARAGILERALALAGARVAGAERPVDGRLRIHVRNRRLRATLAAFPTLYGPRVVVKIIDESLVAREFQELGMSKDVADEVQRLLAARTGVLLVNAPPDHGGTTTFYSFLTHLRGEGGRNVMTLESPVRFPLPGISQTQLDAAGLDVAAGIHAALRQEPDVLGVTEVPDRAALEAVFAAARRCLVVALGGFRDNLQALAWLREAGISPATQGLLLRGLLAQRVLPKLCSGCREPLPEPPPLLEGVRDARVEELAFYAAPGCEHCGGTGRTGKVALFELLSLRGEAREPLLRGEPGIVVMDEAQRLGMWTLREDGILKASQGLADVREVLEATAREDVPA